MTIIEAPKLLGSREEAEELVAQLPADLVGHVIKVSFGATRSVRPSYIDELIRQILVERTADRLILQDVPEGAEETIRRSAVYRRLIDRVEVTSK